MTGRTCLLLAAVLIGILGLSAFAKMPRMPWNDAELAQLRGLAISSLPPVPADPSNRVADDPRAADLGQRIFFDTRFSSNGKVSCASCHLPGKEFQDGIALAKGVGTTDRRTMTIIGTAHSPWQFWDGRKDSQWAQALGPLESPVEHGGNRTQYAHLAAKHYATDYEALFGKLPNLAALPVNAGPVQDPVARAAHGDHRAACPILENLSSPSAPAHAAPAAPRKAWARGAAAASAQPASLGLDVWLHNLTRIAATQPA